VKVIFKKLDNIPYELRDTHPNLSQEMYPFFDGKTVRTVIENDAEFIARGSDYIYGKYFINKKWTNKYVDFKEIERLFNIEL
jgi:hypothetical protein